MNNEENIVLELLRLKNAVKTIPDGVIDRQVDDIKMGDDLEEVLQMCDELRTSLLDEVLGRRRVKKTEISTYYDNVVATFIGKYKSYYNTAYQNKYNCTTKAGSNDASIYLGYVLRDLEDNCLSIPETITLRDYFLKLKCDRGVEEAVQIANEINSLILDRMRIKGGV